MKAFCAAVLSFVLAAGGVPRDLLGDEALAGWFPFPMSGLDATLPDVDVSFLNSTPAGRGGFIRNQQGHFADEQGKRLRFLGTNLTFGGAFPKKSEAERITARLGKLGVNVVRFHHMDNGTAPRGIWQTGRRAFDPGQLDRLDWLIAQLKGHGIYVNLNLHVSRVYPGMSPKLARSFRYGKALDNFYGPYIQLQKDYARELLTHRNPYTGQPYTHEPAVLCVEINNENSLTTTAWGDLADLPDPWGLELRRQWNAWLAKRYTSMDQLRTAWREVDEPLETEMLTNGDFRQGTKSWRLEAPRPAEATMRTVPQQGPRPGMPALRAELIKPGERSWHFQVNQPGLTLKKGRLYTFSFWARSDQARTIRADARLAREPWSHLGLGRVLELTSGWQQFVLPFRATGGQKGYCRVGYVLGNVRGQVWLAGASLKPGGVLGTPKDQSLTQGNIGLTRSYDTPTRQADYFQFLMETERRYHAEMVQFLKQDLGLHSLVVNTQASYGGLAGVVREGTLSDFVDMHGYWQHPRFPGRPWDRRNWYIPNTSMVSDGEGGVPCRIALHRVRGKPFTVSEYNHPAPNDHSAEMLPMLASIAAFQDWDAIYQFCYASSSEELDQPRIRSYFEMVNHPGQLVWLPIAAMIFRTAAVEAGPKPIVLNVPSAGDALQLRRRMTDVWSAAGASPGLAVMRSICVRLGAGAKATLSEQVSRPGPEGVSSTGQIIWHPAGEGRQVGKFLVQAPGVRCAVGFLQDQKVELGDVSFTLQHAARGWASMGLAALDGKPIAQSTKMLLVAVGQVANTGMQWNKERTSVSDRWGGKPTIAEGIRATVRLPGQVNVRALTSDGKTSGTVPVQPQDETSRVEIGPQYQTLWYLVTRP